MPQWRKNRKGAPIGPGHKYFDDQENHYRPGGIPWYFRYVGGEYDRRRLEGIYTHGRRWCSSEADIAAEERAGPGHASIWQFSRTPFED